MECLADMAIVLRKCVRFRWLTADMYSVKLWRDEHPHYDVRGQRWIGEGCCGFVDLDDAKLIAPLSMSTAITEVR